MAEISFVVSRVFLIIVCISAFLLLPRVFYAVLGFTKPKVFAPKHKKNNKFAILVPARDESKVIEDLFIALENQTYKKDNFDVFVIVKSKSDRTVTLTKLYGHTALICENQKCKGDALDYAVKYIFDNKLKYDAFIIFDADNIPTKDFLKEMSKAVESGYDIGIGYRDSKNWNDGWVASCTGLTFSMVNTLSNKGRAKLGVNCVFSGTGYFIAERVLAQNKSWQFKTLTEDYEISLYATLNNLKTTYVEKAKFYDEQPVDLKTSSKQRVRWVKGFVQTRKLYVKKIIKSFFTQKDNKWSKLEQIVGLIPLATIITSAILFVLFQIGFIIASLLMSTSAVLYFWKLLKILVITYSILAIFTAIQLLAEIGKIEINTKTIIKTLLMNPFYTALYVPIAIKAIFTKNVGWDKIEHKKSLKMEEINSEEEKILIEKIS